VARHIFQACPVWIYTQSNITQASYSPEFITPTQQISSYILMYIRAIKWLNSKQWTTTYRLKGQIDIYIADWQLKQMTFMTTPILHTLMIILK
jgi:hypothetical protein